MSNHQLITPAPFPPMTKHIPQVPDPRKPSPVSGLLRSHLESQQVSAPRPYTNKADASPAHINASLGSSPTPTEAELNASVTVILGDTVATRSTPSPKLQTTIPRTPLLDPVINQHNRSQSLRFQSEIHQRMPSVGHGRSIRCSPDCTASNPPFRLLARAIGRASATNVRRALNERPSPLSRDQSSLRPNLQARRSRSKSNTDSSHPFLSQSVPPSAALNFERGLNEGPPPPTASIERAKAPAPFQEFVSDFGSNSSSTTTAEDDLMDGLLSFEAPRNLLTPNVSSSSSGQVSSDAAGYNSLSRCSSLSSPFLGHVMDSLAAEDKGCDHGLSSSLRSDAPMGAAGPAAYPPGIALGRHATIHGHGPLPNDRMGPFGRIIGDPVDLASYLGPELAATLKRRLEEHPGTLPGKKAEVLRDVEWSFEKPLEQVMSQVAATMVSQIGDSRSMQIVEYGCDTDTPNPVIAEIIRGVAYTARDFKAKKLISVTHQCSPSYDIRALQAALASEAESYRIIKALPVATILSSFTFAKFGEVAFAPASVDMGIGRGELSLLHGAAPARSGLASILHREERDKLAHRDLKRWLAARSKEIRSGGLLAFYFAVRTGPLSDATEEGISSRELQLCSPLVGPISSPTSPIQGAFPSPSDGSFPDLQYSRGKTSPPKENLKTSRPDMWQAMNQTLSQAVQRLVTLGEIRPSIAPSLVDVPYWPRSLDQMRKTFDKLEKWEVLRDYSRGQPAERDATEQASEEALSFEERRKWMDAGIRLQRLTHPAWRELVEGTIDRQSYALRVATYCRAVYEDHLKKVLRENAKMDISRTETAIQELFKILVEKCEFGALEGLELDIGVVILRRK